MSTSIGSAGITFPDATVQNSAGLAAGGTIATGTVTTLTTTTLNSTSGVLATQNGMTGIAKAWVNYNGTAGTITGSFNVGSVTKVGTGSYVFNFTTAMPNATYSVVASAKTSDNSTAGANNISFAPFSFATSSVSALTIDAGSGTVKDCAIICVAILSS